MNLGFATETIYRERAVSKWYIKKQERREVDMSKPRIVVGAIIFVVMVLAAAGTSAADPLQSQEPPEPLREPIHVSGNVQASKLLTRVEPVYPELARAARISGTVVLQVTVDVQGKVSDVRVMRGHPLLQRAAVDAVKQWRYAPTLLNGKPVSVLAPIMVAFKLEASETWAFLDEKGNLRASGLQLQGQALIQEVKDSGKTLWIRASPSLPFRTIEELVKELKQAGIREVQVEGFVSRQDRLYQSFVASSSGAPEVVLDRERLAEIVNKAVPSTNPRTKRVVPVAYRLFISESGEIAGLDQEYGPKIPALESELLKVKVVTPGRRGPDPVPAALIIEITGPIRLL